MITIFFTILLINPRPACPQASANPSGATNTRISNGTAVNPAHKYPFMVELWWSGYEANTTEIVADPRRSCGATIIDKHWVMRAAHCLTNVRLLFPATGPPKKTVLTGTHQAGMLEPWSQNITIKDFIAPSILYKRKGYFQRFHTEDIVLIRLATPIIFSDKVTPVNLPPIDFQPLEDFKGYHDKLSVYRCVVEYPVLGFVTDIATLIGWGNIWEGPPGNATAADAVELQEGSLPLMTTETCQRRAGMFQYKTSRGELVSESYDVSEFTLCMGLAELLPEVPVGTCHGDSGGPILLHNPKYDTYFQVGIVSSGYCWYVAPQLNTNVGKYVQWIKWNTRRCQWRNVSRLYDVDD